jgi:hypothetical protein
LLLLVALAGLCVEIARSVSRLDVSDASDAGAPPEDRFDELREHLPKGVVGYLSDANPGQLEGDFAWYWAEYSLAPVLLEPGINHEIVIGNFLRPDTAAAIIRGTGLVIERDCLNGVMLLRRVSR